jgi:hypothetical protein
MTTQNNFAELALGSFETDDSDSHRWLRAVVRVCAGLRLRMRPAIPPWWTLSPRHLRDIGASDVDAKLEAAKSLTYTPLGCLGLDGLPGHERQMQGTEYDQRVSHL